MEACLIEAGVDLRSELLEGAVDEEGGGVARGVCLAQLSARHVYKGRVGEDDEAAQAGGVEEHPREVVGLAL